VRRKSKGKSQIAKVKSSEDDVRRKSKGKVQIAKGKSETF
jgi:hypothetical protein